jgi:hypothetical protein
MKMDNKPNNYLGTEVALANLDCLRENAQALFKAGLIPEHIFVKIMRSLSRKETIHEAQEQISILDESWQTSWPPKPHSSPESLGEKVIRIIRQISSNENSKSQLGVKK